MLLDDLIPALAVDLRGRVYAPSSCTEFVAVRPSVVHVLSPPPDYGVISKITVGGPGACPLATALAVVP